MPLILCNFNSGTRVACYGSAIKVTFLEILFDARMDVDLLFDCAWRRRILGGRNDRIRIYDYVQHGVWVSAANFGADSALAEPRMISGPHE